MLQIYLSYVMFSMIDAVVCAPHEETALAERMQWVALHYGELENVRTEARKIYEEHFTMEAFGVNLEKALYEAEMKWKRDNESEN